MMVLDEKLRDHTSIIRIYPHECRYKISWQSIQEFLRYFCLDQSSGTKATDRLTLPSTERRH